jgi:hypothetical protein
MVHRNRDFSTSISATPSRAGVKYDATATSRGYGEASFSTIGS